MRALHHLLVAASLGFLAGCSDTVTAPFASADGARNGPATLLSSTRVDVLTHGAAGDGSADDTNAIRSAIADAVSRGPGWSVYFPAGNYRITSTISLPSNTHLTGENRTDATIKLDGGFRYAFEARGSGAGHVSGITIERLRFTTTQPNAYQYALGAISAKNVVFDENLLLQVGLVEADIHLPYTDSFGNKSTATVADLTDGVLVRNNVGWGTGAGVDSEEAIRFGYTKNSQAWGNLLRDYHTGVTWWGGNADPQYGAATMGSKRLALNLLVQFNDIENVHNGIWGSFGDSIRVYYNKVAECVDVCLDAERTDNTHFYDNEARNAAGAVMAAYFYSTNVVFENNRITQDRHYGNNFLFRLHNSGQDPANMQITVLNNEFRYTAPTGVGSVQKESALRFYFSGNTLENTVISGAFNNSGTAQIFGNHLTFTRGPGRPAIQMGYSYGMWGAALPPISDTFHLDIRWNTILTTMGTVFERGIEVHQSAGNATINTRINSNEVRGFHWSIYAHSTRTDHVFQIHQNQHTGIIDATTGNVSLAGNVPI